ncbi:RsmB/NOP family class I SAM-dependent RNA methyltransferase [Desulfocurvus vexinensis]|uniref:RsmB/NOP family class I SAM-dependent RNA methyltransferase n=1 Tax=Desulfocurvus vexinensis TaxID=399548 RepID=UPI0004B206B8|nr:transcription antitermination factor NusB [Desulfocurvus vexinensis]
MARTSFRPGPAGARPARLRAASPALPPARRAALLALERCLRGQDIQAALDAALGAVFAPGAAVQPDPAAALDAALATELAYGTLRRKPTLDFILATLLRDPAALPGPMRLLLAVAAYEILFLDRIPAYASVHWATEQVKTAINPRLAKVCNAVLRRVADLGSGWQDAAFLGQPPLAHEAGLGAGARADEALVLARRFGVPRWLAALWLGAYGPTRAQALLAASCQAPPLGLRLRPGVTGAMERHAGLAALPSCLASTATGVALAAAPEDLDALLASGRAVRQSLAGQLALAALGADHWPRPVWDACCGRGGKTLLLADDAPGTVLASDPNARRLAGLNAERRRLGVAEVAVFRARAEQVFWRRPLPAILLDAPCSGLGVLSRRPDTLLRRTPDDITALAGVQARLLEHAARCLAPGGVLAYVTCTVTPAENEGQVERFLAAHPDFRLAATHTTPQDAPLGEFFHAVRLERRA